MISSMPIFWRRTQAPVVCTCPRRCRSIWKGCAACVRGPERTRRQEAGPRTQRERHEATMTAISYGSEDEPTPTPGQAVTGHVVGVRGTVVEVEFGHDLPPLGAALYCQLNGDQQ